MATDSTELTFVRCPSCRSLVPAVSSRCRMCGSALESVARQGSDATDESGKFRARQKTLTSQNQQNAGDNTEVAPVAKMKAPEPAPVVSEEPPIDDPLSAYIEEVDVFESAMKPSQEMEEQSVVALEQVVEPEVGEFDAMTKSAQNTSQKVTSTIDDEVDWIDEYSEPAPIAKTPSKVEQPEVIHNNNGQHKHNVAVNKEQQVRNETHKVVNSEKSKPAQASEREHQPSRQPPRKQEEPSRQQPQNQQTARKQQEPNRQQPDNQQSARKHEEPGRQNSQNQRKVDNRPSQPVASGAQGKHSGQVNFAAAQSSQGGLKSKDSAVGIVHKPDHFGGRLLGWLVSFTDKKGRAVELREGKFFVTSTSIKPNDLVIEHETVSAPHAMVAVSLNNGLIVQDLMSEHGVHVKRVGQSSFQQEEEACVVVHGDWVRFGKAEFLVSILPEWTY